MSVNRNYIYEVRKFEPHPSESFFSKIKLPHIRLPKTKDLVTQAAQFAIGFGLGRQMYRIYAPLTSKILSKFGMTHLPLNPFHGSIVNWVLTPIVCFVAPVLEEQLFRRDIQSALTKKFQSFYAHCGFSDPVANNVARVTSIFFTSLVFGLSHFSNALIFLCSPVYFLPQVVATTIMGVMLGVAKEFSGGLSLPIGMHMGNNILAWTS